MAEDPAKKIKISSFKVSDVDAARVSVSRYLHVFTASGCFINWLGYLQPHTCIYCGWGGVGWREVETVRASLDLRCWRTFFIILA